MTCEALTVQYPTRTGVKATINAVTAADGFTFPNDGHTVLFVMNDEGNIALVFTIRKTLDGQAVTRTATVTASENWFVGPFPPEIYNDGDDLVLCTPGADLTGTTEGVAVISY